MYLKTRTLSISVISPNSESSYKLCSDAPIKVKTNLFFNFFFSAPIRIIYSSTLLFKIRVLINRHVKVITLLRAQTNHPRPLLKSSNSSSWRDPVIWGLSTSLAVLGFRFWKSMTTKHHPPLKNRNRPRFQKNESFPIESEIYFNARFSVINFHLCFTSIF